MAEKRKTFWEGLKITCIALVGVTILCACLILIARGLWWFIQIIF